MIIQNIWECFRCHSGTPNNTTRSLEKASPQTPIWLESIVFTYKTTAVPRDRPSIVVHDRARAARTD